MLPVIYLKDVEPITAGKPLGSGRAGALHLLPQLDPGEILSARVEAKLPDGSYKVMVAGQPLRMNLPAKVAPGDTLEFAFLAREPRPTFALKNIVPAATSQPGASTPTPASVAATATQANTMNATQTGAASLAQNAASGNLPELVLVAGEPRPTFALQNAPASAAPAAPAPVLSAAGRLIAATMLQPGEVPLPVETAATAPLLAATPGDGAGLAGGLARTLAASGLFYEAHQAEWVAGKLDLAQLRQEPQARLSQAAPQPQTQATRTAPEAPVGVPATPSGEHAARHAYANQQSVAQAIHPRTAPLVQQQLAALDTGKLVLQLEIWPRQWMQWEIEEDRPDQGRGEPEVQPSWNTRLRLQLPQLGELKAALNLGGSGLQIKLEADNADSAARLREHSPSLHAALAAAGVTPAGIAITEHQHEHA